MLRKVFKSFFITIVCICSLSCTFINEQEGSISFKLPSLRESYDCSRNAAVKSADSEKELKSEKVAFDILLKNRNGKVFYEEEKYENDTVHISSIPVGRYVITVSAENDKYTFFGEKEVNVKAGVSVSVLIKLTPQLKPDFKPEPEPTPDPKPLEPVVKTGNISGLITDGPDTSTGIVLSVFAQKAGEENAVPAKGYVVDNKHYSFTSLAVGTYNISVTGSNDLAYYYGEIKDVVVKEGDNEGPDIIVKLSDKLGTVKGNVILPENKEGLVLTAYATNTVTKGNFAGQGEVNISNGEFVISNIPVGTYKISVSGGNDSAFYAGELKEAVNVQEGENQLPESLALTETSKKGGIKISLSTNVSESARFTIDVKKKEATTSIDGFPKSGLTKKDFPYSINGLEPGNYDISIKGSDEQYDYVPEHEWNIVEIKSGINDKIFSIELKKTQINGTISGNLTGFDVPKDVKLNVEAKEQSGTKVITGTVTGKKYEIKDIPVGTYTVVVSGSTNSEEYNGSVKDISISASNTNVTTDVVISRTLKIADLKVILKDGSSNLDISNAEISYSINDNTKKTSISKNPFTIKNLNVGSSYKVNISGESKDKKYSYSGSGNVTIATKNNVLNIDLTKTENEVTVPDEDFKPEPDKRIFCVDGVNGDDNTDGTGCFKTIAGAVNKLKNGDKFTLKVKGPVTETACADTQKGFDIIGAESTPTKVTLDIPSSAVAGSEPAWLSTSATSTIDKLNITTTKNNGTTWCLKVNGGTLELGNDAIVKNEAARNSAVLAMSNGTIILSKPANINSLSNVQVYGDSHIKAKKGFSNNKGIVNVNLNKEMDGKEQANGAFWAGYEILQCEDSNEMSASASKFVVIKGSYDIDASGKLAEKPKAIEVSNLSGFTDAISNAKDGSTILVKNVNTMDIGIMSPITVDKNITIKADGSFGLLRSSNYYDTIINIGKGATVTLEGFKINGGQSANAPIINCNGSLILKNCNLLNNKNMINTPETGVKSAGAIYVSSTGTKLEVTNSTITNNNGLNGAIYVEGNNTDINITSSEMNNNSLVASLNTEKGKNITIAQSSNASLTINGQKVSNKFINDDIGKTGVPAK